MARVHGQSKAIAMRSIWVFPWNSSTFLQSDHLVHQGQYCLLWMTLALQGLRMRSFTQPAAYFMIRISCVCHIIFIIQFLHFLGGRWHAGPLEEKPNQMSLFWIKTIRTARGTGFTMDNSQDKPIRQPWFEVQGFFLTLHMHITRYLIIKKN